MVVSTSKTEEMLLKQQIARLLEGKLLLGTRSRRVAMLMWKLLFIYLFIYLSFSF